MKPRSPVLFLRLALAVLVLTLLMGAAPKAIALPVYVRSTIQTFPGEVPYGLALDLNGDYILGVDSSIVRINRTTGARTTLCQVAPAHATQIYDLAVDANGNFVVAMFWANKVARVDRTSCILGTPVQTDVYWFPSSPSDGASPLGVSIDPVTGDYIVPWAGGPSPYRQGVARITPAGGFQNIYNIANDNRGAYEALVTSTGDYVVAEQGNNPWGSQGVLASVSSNGSSRVPLYSFPTGAFPTGLAIDGNGDYIVTEPGTAPPALARFHDTGAGYTRQVIYSAADWRPDRVIVDSDGSFVVVETSVASIGGGRLVRIAPATPPQMVTTLKTAIDTSLAVTGPRLDTYLNSAAAYLNIGTPTMKAAACQQLKLFKAAIDVAARTDPIVATNAPVWIAQAAAIWTAIPCPGSLLPVN